MPTTNASHDGSAVHIELRSSQLVLIDPLALDGLREELQGVATASPSDKPPMLESLGQSGLRIGLAELDAFQPGVYRLDIDCIAPANDKDPDPGIFQIDSGTVVVMDLAALGPVARTLTWDRYDEYLQSPIGDDSRLEAINSEVGGPYFAIISSDANRPFSGDGAFRLLTDRVARVPGSL